jgi:hypothetical protein
VPRCNIVTIASSVGCSAIGPTGSPLQDDRRPQLGSEHLHLLGPRPTAAILLQVAQQGLKLNGKLVIEPPKRTDGRDRGWPCYSLQPGTKEAIAAEISVLWAQSAGAPA